MEFTQTELRGVYLIEIERLEDERGFFARTYCRQEFERQGLNPCVAQCNVSFNTRRGTLRGMHYAADPHAEIKLVRCTQGAMLDVIVDLRGDSPTFKHWLSIELSAANHRMVYIPEGCAHGFQTLEDNTEVHYQMSEFYHPNAARGVRWNDPAFGIRWPVPSPILSKRDQSYPDFIQSVE